jgi:lysophospholipase L1-like esterase
MRAIRTLAAIAVLPFLLACAALAQAPRDQTASPDKPAQSASATTTGTLCNVPRDLIRFKHGLPNLARALAKGDAVDIIALGSSSTAGSGASNPSASYPARLDMELDRRFPGKDFRVANYGTGGMLARDMLDRIHDRIATMPQPPALVVWQTGVNDAVQDIGLAQFAEILHRGILDLKSAGIDVILVDMQFYPRSERVAVYGDYLRAMRRAADADKVPLFQRFSVMKHLIKSGQHTPEELLAPDNFHLNDLSYGCLAELLADSIEEQIKAGRINASQMQSAPPTAPGTLARAPITP